MIAAKVAAALATLVHMSTIIALRSFARNG
jgi:hypothetical protein